MTILPIDVDRRTVRVVRVFEGPPGPEGPKGDTGSGGGTDLVPILAGATLSGHRVVCPTGAAVDYASNTTPAHASLPLWLTTGALTSGAEAEAVAFGVVVEDSWVWVPGGPIYLGVNGLLTQSVPTAPAFLRQVAVAVSETSLFFDPQQPIVLT